MKHQQAFLFALAILMLVAVLADLFLWFSITGSAQSFEQARLEYVSHYPAGLQNARMLTVISLLLLTLAGFIFLTFAGARRMKAGASLLGLFCALLMMWKIFSLM